MTIVTRENIHLELIHPLGRDDSDPDPGVELRTYSGTLSWDTGNGTLDLLDPGTGERILRLSEDPGSVSGGVSGNTVLIMDVPHPARVRGVVPEANGVLSSLRTLGVISRFPRVVFNGRYSAVELSDDLGAAAQAACTRTATVTLFRDSGKYYTGEAWRVPVKAIIPADMRMSPDFRRIGGGPVLVDTDASSDFRGAENWGFPHLFPAETGDRSAG